MGITCREIFEGSGAALIGDGDVPIGGIAYDSRRVAPGDAFFCVVGHELDGHSFAQEAIDRGAKVLVVERVPHLADATGVTEVVVSDTRKAMAAAASRFCGDPSADLTVVGITGANGRTTVARLVEHVAQAAGRPSGAIGEGMLRLAGVDSREDALCESPDLQRALARMGGARADVVAVALDADAVFLEKAWSTRFAVTAFTDRSHKNTAKRVSLEASFEAKARLLSADYPASRVICIDSTWGRELLRRASAAGDDVVTTGFDASAQVRFVEMGHDPTSPFVVLSVRGQDVRLSCGLSDERDAQDLMCAFGICLQLGLPVQAVARALESAPPIAELRERWDPRRRGSAEEEGGPACA